MKNKFLIGTVAFVAVLAVIGILAVSFTMTPALATNKTNVTEKIAINCTTAIAVPDSSIDVGAGYIPQICIDCWIGMNTTSCEGYTGGTGYYNTTGQAVTVINTKDFTDKCWVNTTALNLPESIHIKNKGNNYISLSINLLDDADWTNQSGSPEFGNNALEVFLEQGMSTPGSDDTAASCIDGMVSVENEASLTLNYPTSLCTGMAWAEDQNEVYLFDKFIINPKTEPKQYTMTKEISATEAQCGGEYVPVDPQISMARVDPPSSAIPNKTAYQFGNYGAFVETPAAALVDSGTTLSTTYSLAFDNSLSGNKFMALGTGLGSADAGNYRYYDSSFGSKSIAGMTNAKWDANVGGSTIGGTAIALANCGAYLLQGKGGSTGVGDVYVIGGAFNSGFTAPTTPIGNLCSLYSITCTATNTPAAIFDMFTPFNAAQHPNAVLGAVFANTGGADTFVNVAAANAALTKIAQTPMTIPLVANSDAIRSAAYSPFNGELLVWVDAAPYTNTPNDYIASFILIRNGNDITGILPIANWPVTTPMGPPLVGNTDMYGLAVHVDGIPPGFSAQAQTGLMC